MRAICHASDNEKQFLLKVRIFRAFNLAIIAAFLDYNDKLKNAPGSDVISSGTKWKEFGRRSAMHRANKN